MKFYGIDAQGKFIIEKVSSLPSWTASDESRIVYLDTTNTLYGGTSTEWKNIGMAATSGTSGTGGTSGSSGIAGNNGTSGTSGTSGMSTWTSYFDNTCWSSVYNITWNAGQNRWETSDQARLQVTGTWANGFRPTKFRMTFSSTDYNIDSFYMRDNKPVPQNNIFYVYGYVSPTSLNCTFTEPYNIKDLTIGETTPMHITNIEFSV